MPSLRGAQSAYAYPASNALWKNTMQVVHTAAVPPNHGRICFAISGCTRKIRNADSVMTIAKAMDDSWTRKMEEPHGSEALVVAMAGKHATRDNSERPLR